MKNEDLKKIVQELKNTDDVKDVQKCLSQFHDRYLFLEIINYLLNELSDVEIELSIINRQLKKEKEKELEII